jgi:hypothetical protein
MGVSSACHHDICSASSRAARGTFPVQSDSGLGGFGGFFSTRVAQPHTVKYNSHGSVFVKIKEQVSGLTLGDQLVKLTFTVLVTRMLEWAELETLQ